MKATAPLPSDARPALLEYGICVRDRRPFYQLVRNLLIGGAVLIFLAYTVLPMWSRHQYKQNARVQCSIDMRHICWAAIVYANDHGRRLPDDLDTLFQFAGMNPETFVCTATEADLPSAPTTQAVYSKLKQAGSISYIYLGKGVTLDSPADTIILCEPLENHDTGINVGFVDGTMQWLPKAEAKRILNQVRNGSWPLRWNSGGASKR